MTQLSKWGETEIREAVDGALAPLVGQALLGWSRAADLTCFQFGPAVVSPGSAERQPIWALHVQCSWRITRRGVIIAALGDLYYPRDYDRSARVPNGFDWDRDSNRLDQLQETLFSSERYLPVSGRRAGSVGAFRLDLEAGYRLEVWPDISLPTEHWRIFRHDGQVPHFVLEG